MELSNSVIMPREDFVELQTAAWNMPDPTPGSRVASTIQTTAICLGVSLAVTAGTAGWAYCVNRLEKLRHERWLAKANTKNANPFEK